MFLQKDDDDDTTNIPEMDPPRKENKAWMAKTTWKNCGLELWEIHLSWGQAVKQAAAGQNGEVLFLSYAPVGTKQIK